MDAAFFERKFCSAKVPMTLPACAGVEQIFAPLYQISQQLRAPYYKLKAQEVLLYLGWQSRNGSRKATSMSPSRPS